MKGSKYNLDKDLLYDSITPVNTFRIILNHYFNAGYDLLKDDVYFSNEGFGRTGKLVASKNNE